MLWKVDITSVVFGAICAVTIITMSQQVLHTVLIGFLVTTFVAEQLQLVN